MSYHIHSSVVFSDGKIESNPSKPENNNILICPECKKAFWKEDAISKDTEDTYNDHLPQALDIFDLPFAFEDDFSGKLTNYYSDLLETGFATSIEKEVFLRIEIWHLMNNLIRYKPLSLFKTIKKGNFKYAFKKIGRIKNDKLEFEKKIIQFNLNLTKLISIFKPEFDEQKLLLAEMYRELGEFSKALSLLDEINDSENQLAHKQIYQASNRKETEVFKIN